MTDKQAMLELADRIEAAEGPCRELDAAIASAVRYFPKDVGFIWQHDLKPNSPEPGRVECCTSLGTGGPHYKAPSYTASLDAAMTLVPEGWCVDGMKESRSGPFWAVLRRRKWKPAPYWVTCKGANLALALSAAAICALASQEADRG